VPLIGSWLQAFLWTLGVELVVAGAALRGRASLGRRLALVTVANVATHPAVWLILPEVGASYGWPRWVTLALSELWAFGFEAFVYALFLGAEQRRAAMAASLMANGASWGMGYLLRAVRLL
jgi:hypothetical protein